MRKLFALLFGITVVLSACSDDDDNNDKYITFGFESVSEASLAGQTSKGENLYDPRAEMGSYTGTQFITYHDTKTDITFGINDGDKGHNFWHGGIAASRWNIMTTESMPAGKNVAGPDNQCSVFYKASNGNGGRGGSKTFGVVGMGGPASISFKTATTEYEAESIWVTNSTYATLVMENGDEEFSITPLKDIDGWFKLTIEGKDAAGKSTGKVDFYLADLRTSTSKGIVKEWTLIDLTSLGKVHKLEFSVTGSDMSEDTGWGSWLNTPAYVCIDDLKFKVL